MKETVKNERKYHVLICSCGGIHFLPADKIDEAIINGKNFVCVCGKCGKIHVIGADEFVDEFDSEGKTAYSMYHYVPNDTWNSDEYRFGDIKEIASDNHSDFKFYNDTVYYSKPVPVYMMSGNKADHYLSNNSFADFSSFYLDFMGDDTATIEEARSEVNDKCRLAMTVNMPRLIDSLTDDQCKALSSLVINNLDWVGTEYEDPWHTTKSNDSDK